MTERDKVKQKQFMVKSIGEEMKAIKFRKLESR